MKTILTVLALAVLPMAAHAEIVASAANGFTVKTSVETKLAPAAAFKRFTKVGDWWSSDHSYSHDVKKNMRMDARAGGCWCETAPGGGSVEHMRVVFVLPNKEIRLSGGLGPMQTRAVSGAMDVTFEPAGTGTKVTMTYSIGGFSPGGLDPMAAPVDGVLTDAMKSFAGAP